MSAHSIDLSGDLAIYAEDGRTVIGLGPSYRRVHEEHPRQMGRGLRTQYVRQMAGFIEQIIKIRADNSTPGTIAAERLDIDLDALKQIAKEEAPSRCNG